MATITTTIGAGDTHDSNINIVSTSGSGPYLVTVDDSSGASVGDALYDEAPWTPGKHLILAVVDGTTLSCATDPSDEGEQVAKVKRYYSGSTPLTDWEGDLDSSIYSEYDAAVGVVYKDAPLDEAVTINGGSGVGLTSITLTVAEGERHNGTEGTGATIKRTGTGDVLVCSSSVTTNVEWLEIDGNGNSDSELIRCTSAINRLSQLIIHDSNGTSANGIEIANVNANIMNCFVYDITCTATGSARCAGLDVIAGGSARTYNILNNTVHDIINNSGSGDAFCIGVSDSGGNKDLKNNIATDPSGTSSGTIQCYSDSSYTSVDSTNNLASDTSASGTYSLDSIVSGNQYVSNSAPYDLHLKSGADADGAGTDLAASPSGVEIDIDGFSRHADSSYDPWDCGAHELQTAAASGTKGTLALIGVGV